MNPRDVAHYMTRIRHCHGTHVRVFVNDLPMYDKAVLDFCAPTFGATPWFVPGENRVVIEVNDGPINPGMPTVPRHFHLLFFHQGENLETDETTLYEKEYPTFLAELPEAERKLPCRWTDTFTPKGQIPEPIWADAAPEPIPEKGTPELLKAVYDLHVAFSRRDVDALVGAAALKLEDMQRYFGPQSWNIPSEVKKEHAEMMAEPWDLAPFEPDRLRFRSCAGGRVAYATYEDGGPAVRARHKIAPTQTWAVKPLLVRQGADWRIYR
jgi:hypothetical protein